MYLYEEKFQDILDLIEATRSDEDVTKLGHVHSDVLFRHSDLFTLKGFQGETPGVDVIFETYIPYLGDQPVVAFSGGSDDPSVADLQPGAFSDSALVDRFRTALTHFANYGKKFSALRYSEQALDNALTREIFIQMVGHMALVCTLVDDAEKCSNITRAMAFGAFNDAIYRAVKGDAQAELANNWV